MKGNNLINKSSIRNLVTSNIDGINLSYLIRGDSSYSTIVSERSFECVPSDESDYFVATVIKY